MAEEQEEAGSTRPQAVGADPAGVALGLAAAGRETADTYLKKQGRLADLQHEILANCEAFEVSHLRWRRFGDQMKGALQIMGVLIGLGVVSAIGVMVWCAVHSNGLRIEAFSVPPDLAARGLTGEVVAGQLLDKVRAAQDIGPNSVAQGQAASASWADDIKVEIPETGVSLGEVYRFLRQWLGHETMVGGEVVRTAEGLAITIRVGSTGGVTYAGPEAGFDAVALKAAEHVVEVTDPSRLANHLIQLNSQRIAEGQAILERLTADPASAPRLKAQSWNGLAILYAQFKGDGRTSLVMYRRAREADPTYALGYSNGVTAEYLAGHAEAALALVPDALRVLANNSSYWSPGSAETTRISMGVTEAILRGDLANTVSLARTAMAVTGVGARPLNPLRNGGQALAQQHDGAVWAWLDQIPPALTPANSATMIQTRLQAQAWLENWPAVLATEAAAEKAIAGLIPTYDLKLRFATQLRPWLALARAKTGDSAGAEAVIGETPGDCYDCTRVRGLIAAEVRQWGRADFWFARAVHDAPSPPFAYTDWGQSLLVRGKLDEAIAQFTLANQKGPKFADPLEMWGETLMAKNRSDLALAKFTEAEKYAFNWGRLHLKWGEALGYVGKPEEAKKQFALAAGLDLTPGEKAELARQSPHA